MSTETLAQETVNLTTTVTEEVAPGGTVTFVLPEPYTTDQLLAGQTVYLTVYSREFPDLETALGDNFISVGWPADAPYPMPPGEYNCAFQTTYVPDGEGGLPPGLTQVANQPDAAFGVNPAVAIAEDADLPTAVLAINNLVVSINDLMSCVSDLVLQYNALLAAMQASGVMASATPAKSKAKAKAKK